MLAGVMCAPAERLMTTYSVLLFDLDGTLLDSVPLIVESFEHAFLALGRTPPPRDEILRGVGTPLSAYFARWTADPAEHEALVAGYRAFNLAHHDARVSAFDGVVGLVEDLRRAGCRTGIVTSKNHQTARRGLEVMGLADAFEVVVGCDDVRRPKPDREPVDVALERLRWHDRVAVLFVGDSLHDLECGRAAGVATAAALWGPFDREHLARGEPTHWLESPDDLREVLGVAGGGTRNGP
jgi:pyrophosphatase PpaX